MKSSNTKLGITYCLLSFFLASIMGALAKVATGDQPTIAIIFVQNVISFLIIIPFVFKQGITQLKTRKIHFHILRAVTGSIAWYCLFEGIKLVSLNTSVLLCYVAPLWIPIIASVFLKEHVASKVWTGVLIGFLGIMLVLGIHIDQNANPYGLIVSIIAGISMAIALITIRILNRSEKTLTILFYYFLISSLLILPIAWPHLKEINLTILPYMIAIGICLVTSQLCIVKAYHYESAVKLSPYIYSTIIFSTLIDSLVWHTLISTLQLIGMLLVISGGVVAAQAPKKEEPI